MPGGESTTIGKLLVKYGFLEPIKELFKREVPIYGTCAGLILLAGSIAGQPRASTPPLLGLIDIEVRRNAFGRQRESFEADLNIPKLGPLPFRGVFIRAPWIESVGPNVEVMAKFEDKIVMAQEGKLLVTAFHPELTNDPRIHKYFIEMVAKVERHSPATRPSSPKSSA
jgi:5'-phosphate synthase pdxT subunit